MWTWSLGRRGTSSDHAGHKTDGGNLVHMNLGLRELTRVQECKTCVCLLLIVNTELSCQ